MAFTQYEGKTEIELSYILNSEPNSVELDNMKQDHLLKFDGRGQLHCHQILAEYLPGLDPGLTALAPSEALIAGTTLHALKLAYGDAGSANVLRTAGVLQSHPLSETQALARLAKRDFSHLPARPTAGVPVGWHLDEVNARTAWQQHWGGPDNIDWGPVKVGQIDTGYTQHPVFGFGSGSWLEVAEARTFFAAGADGGDPGPGFGIDPLATLMDGHGTRVGSVICGHDVAAPGGNYLGVAPKVPLVPVRIANTVLITHAQQELAEALRYLVNDAKVSVVNLSMGFLPRTQIKALDKAIDETYMAGVILICAAGQPLRNVVSPAHGRRTVAVAGTTVGSVPWGQSAYGSAVDWAAPAAHIERANSHRPKNFVYAKGGDGTSYAAAITSGAAALWIARHGSSLSVAYPEAWQRIEAFKTVVKATARPMPNQQPGSFGAGILDIAALLNAPLPAGAALHKEAPA
jgi:Subtilase family